MQQPPEIVVVGSVNTDMVVATDRFPSPGETVMGGRFLMNPGGKGANQAVAAARLGGQVAFVGRVGDDLFGREAQANLRHEGIDTSQLQVHGSLPSGIALITVDQRAENTIVVAPGANMALSESDIDRAMPLISAAGVLLLQLETPIETVLYAARKAFEKGVKVILNPAPAAKLPDSLYPCLYLIVPNQTEASLLTGIETHGEPAAMEAAKTLAGKGVANVVITLGAAGAYVFSAGKGQLVPAPSVKALDTTAAGDTFNGALAVGVCQGLPLEAAVAFANRAAAFSVTRMGAQASIPRLAELSGGMNG